MIFKKPVTVLSLQLTFLDFLTQWVHGKSHAHPLSNPSKTLGTGKH